jgi:glucosyl-3-phosphoglycerate synthase
VLRRLASEQVSSRAGVVVSHSPWDDLVEIMREEQPDLLLVESPEQVAALGVSATRILGDAPCDVALVRGPLAPTPVSVLVPIRGGPHAELSLRLALRLAKTSGIGVTSLHVVPPGDIRSADAPFRGIGQVVARLPEVTAVERVTDDPVSALLDEAKRHDIVVLGTTAQAQSGTETLGTVADRVLRECQSTVIAVKTRRPMPMEFTEAAGQAAISILVDRWFAENTFHADEFRDLQRLVEAKRRQELTVSLALPALNEEETVGHVIQTLKTSLMDRVPLLDEIVLIDSDSTDRTRDIARELGIPVHVHQEILPQYGARKGKGEALWKSLYVTRGDIVAWVDTDIVNMHPRFVYGIVGPMLMNPRIQFVKGYYRRPLKVDGAMQAGEGGRVTELTVRPLLNLYFPELSGFVQPLSGEYGGRRSVLEQLPFPSGYGVESGLLIDIFEKFGLFALAQVDLLERIHHNQPLEALSKMSFAILQTIMGRLEKRIGASLLGDVNRTMKLIRYQAGQLYLDVEEIVERERLPMIELPEYRRAFAR